MANPQEQKAIDKAEFAAHQINNLVKDAKGRMCHCLVCRTDGPEMGQPISSIKWAGRTSTKKCPTCHQPVGKPYRLVLYTMPNKPIARGCVDQCHGPYLEPGSPDHQWHIRPKAVKTRMMVMLGIPE